MALVELTGKVAAWSEGLAEGLERHGEQRAASTFRVAPPFSHADEGDAAYRRLAAYLEAGTEVLGALLTAGP